MIKPNRLDAVAGYALAFVVATVAMVLLSCAAHGAPVCRSNGFCAPVVKSFAPVYQQQAYVAPTYYAPQLLVKVGSHLEQQAAAEHAFKYSPSYERLLRAEAKIEGMQEVLAALSATGYVEGGNPNQPQFGTQAEIRYPTLAAMCGKCHTGANAKGGVILDGIAPIADSETRDLIIEAIRSGRMPANLPEGQRLDKEVIHQIEDELYEVQIVEPAPEQVPVPPPPAGPGV